MKVEEAGLIAPGWEASLSLQILLNIRQYKIIPFSMLLNEKKLQYKPFHRELHCSPWCVDESGQWKFSMYEECRLYHIESNAQCLHKWFKETWSTAQLFPCRCHIPPYLILLPFLPPCFAFWLCRIIAQLFLYRNSFIFILLGTMATMPKSQFRLCSGNWPFTLHFFSAKSFLADTYLFAK